MLMDHLREYNLKDLAGGVQYRLWGRTGAADDRLYLFWTGSSLEFNLRATELWVTLESSYMVFENWVDVLVNGELIQRFMVPQGRSEFCLFRGMDRTDGVFEEVPQPALRLEFIGDSLTSGEGLTGAGDYLEWNPGCFSAIHSYAFRATQMLGAECSILSQSGWGTCFSWEGVRREAMPLYYRQRGAFADWDFDSWKPDAVIVHLGTNDEMAIQTVDGCEEEEFEEAAFRFLVKLRERNPESLLLWCYGMLGHTLEDPIRRAMERFRIQTNDTNHDILFLVPTGDDELGGRDHPGRAAHERAARMLAERLRRDLGLT